MSDQLSPEQIKQMIEMLQNMLPVSQPKKETKPKAKKKKSPIKTKKMSVDADESNKFLEMSEMHMHKNDAEIDKRLKRFPPTPRSRPFQLVSVRCRVCGRTEDVHPKLILDSIERYKCNNCSTSEG